MKRWERLNKFKGRSKKKDSIHIWWTSNKTIASTIILTTPNKRTDKSRNYNTTMPSQLVNPQTNNWPSSNFTHVTSNTLITWKGFTNSRQNQPISTEWARLHKYRRKINYSTSNSYKRRLYKSSKERPQTGTV